MDQNHSMIEIINVYSNVPMPGTDLIGKHGQSFLFKVGNDQILMDSGGDGKTLLHNMRILGIDPNDLTHLIFTHGHDDHTGGLPDLLDARSTSEPLNIIGHPLVREQKRLKVLFIKKPNGFPELSDNQEKKIHFISAKEPYEVSEIVKTTGEIIEREEKDGTEPTSRHFVDGKLVQDTMMDDISVIIDTSKGLIVITGCAHAGILNILKKTKQISNKPILAIFGGTHMVRWSKDEVIQAGKRFINEFDDPDLYLNHCTDHLPVKILPQTKSIDILREKFNPDKIKTCYVGSRVQFDD